MKHFFGAALAVAGFVLISHGASAQSLDEVLRRLDALEKKSSRLEAVEKKNAILEQENAELRGRVRRIENKPAVAAAPPPPSPVPTKTGYNKFMDNTVVTFYGHVDVSAEWLGSGVPSAGFVGDCTDYTCPGGAPGVVPTRKSFFAISSNTSYFGVRAVHDLGPNSGLPGWQVLLQFEALVDTSSTPTERSAFGSRDSYVGLQGPYGAFKIGKTDTPYKKSTALFDPMRNTIGDYNSIMGNTGGDIRAEFDARLPHSIWYESPTVNGFQWSVLVSPGQNSSLNNDNFALGEFNCTGSSPRGSGSAFPVGGIGAGACTDGAYGTAFSTALTYKNGPATAIAAYEAHWGVNRTGDEINALICCDPAGMALATLPPGSVGIATEWAAKGGLGYRIGDTQLYGIFEHMQRNAPMPMFNERTRSGTYASATQYVGQFWELSAAWAHAFRTPGDPLRFNPNGTPVSPDNHADMLSLMARYKLSKSASIYLVGADLRNGPGAHYCLGTSGHGVQDCSRDALNNTIHGANILAVSSGLTLDF